MWPPSLDELKTDLKIALDDTRDDERLNQSLDASVALIERVHHGRYNFAQESGSDLPDPDSDLRLGVLRLAGRWDVRRKSPDGMISMGELGAGRVSSFDLDIDRLCRIGRFAPSVFA